jgi:hypothetical protein
MKDLTIKLEVNRTPEECFTAIRNVWGWWSETIEGATENVGDEFTYRHKDLHFSVQKLTEVVPAKKIEWIVTESHLTFLENKSEWNGTRILFDISSDGKATQILFTHKGLTPAQECYGACSEGWGYYIGQSLLVLINTGKGKPDLKETTSATSN